jgi:hypothetical protein
MNSFSDIVGRKQPQHAETDSPFMLRKVESSRAIAARLTPQASDTEPEDEKQATDPLILGLLERLPKAGRTWCFEDRVRWLRTADSIFDLIYGADDQSQKEIKIAVAEP